MVDQQSVEEARQALIEDYASFWWSQESGETETWDELDADERENVIENSYAEHVADWLHEHIANWPEPSFTPAPTTDGGQHA